MPADTTKTSSYLKYLPAILGEDPFLGRFLLAFEQVLTGLEQLEPSVPKPQKGLEEIIAEVDYLFTPAKVDANISGTEAIFTHIARLSDSASAQEMEKEFLQWLAGWTALILRADWGSEQQRKFLAKIIPLYRYRGTKKNLEELLQIYTGLVPVIEEPEDTPFQIGVNSQVEVNTRISGSVPHFFRVTVNMSSPDQATLQRQKEIISALIELQKPAHTFYELTMVFNTMRIGGDPPEDTPKKNQPIQVGVNTLLGSIPD